MLSYYWFVKTFLEKILFEDSLLYFNSAMAQSMAALIAIVGMFTVFRIGIQENKLSKINDNIKIFLQQGHGCDTEMFLDKDAKFQLRKVNEDLPENHGVRDYRIELHNQLAFKVFIVKTMKPLIKTMAVLFITSIVFLPLSRAMSTTAPVLSLLYLVVMITAAIIVIRNVVRYIIRTTNDPKELIFNVPVAKATPTGINMDLGTYNHIYEYVDFIEREITDYESLDFLMCDHQKEIALIIQARKERHIKKLNGYYKKNYIKVTKDGLIDVMTENVPKEILDNIISIVIMENSTREAIFKFITTKIFDETTNSEIGKVFYQYYEKRFPSYCL